MRPGRSPASSAGGLTASIVWIREDREGWLARRRSDAACGAGVAPSRGALGNRHIRLLAHQITPQQGPPYSLPSMRQWRIVCHAVRRDAGLHENSHCLHALHLHQEQGDLTPQQTKVLSRLVREEFT